VESAKVTNWYYRIQTFSSLHVYEYINNKVKGKIACLCILWKSEGNNEHVSISAVTYHSTFLIIYVKGLYQTGAEDTVTKLIDHNSESDTDQSKGASRTSHQTQLKYPALGNLLFVFSENREISISFLNRACHI
jgi:hypothetical protein